jgi:hypothetical protein
MIDLSIWAFADVLTVEQAACLWVRSDPAANQYRRCPDEVTRIAAIVQALSGAIATNSLAADSSRNALASIGDYSKSLVTRRALQGFAESKGERPQFLFDTLLPRATELPAPNKGGRPAEDDWDAFTVEITPGVPGSSQIWFGAVSAISFNSLVQYLKSSVAHESMETSIAPVLREEKSFVASTACLTRVVLDLAGWVDPRCRD